MKRSIHAYLQENILRNIMLKNKVRWKLKVLKVQKEKDKMRTQVTFAAMKKKKEKKKLKILGKINARNITLHSKNPSQHKTEEHYADLNLN